jgi:tetratricopeptide (TPR) repeat protein
MIFRRILFLALFLISAKLSFAGELAHQEAFRYYNEGVKEQRGGDYNGASIACQKALMLAPDNGDLQKYIINNTGVMYAQRGEFKTAEAAFKEALLMDPDFGPAHMNLGLIYDAKGDRQKSLEYWSKYFEIDKRKPKAFSVAGEHQAK